MTNTEIVDNNMLIAEFMHSKDETGAYTWYDGNPSENSVWIAYTEHSAKFNTSWDWLMPVIDKIKNECEEPEELDSLKYVIWWGTISDVYKEVCELIKLS